MKNLNACILDNYPLSREGLIKLLNETERFNLVKEIKDFQDFENNVLDDSVDLAVIDLDSIRHAPLAKIRNLRLNNPQLKIVIFSASHEHKFIYQLIQVGINGYIFKTSNLAEIKMVIIAILEKGHYFDKEIKDLVGRQLLNGSGRKVNGQFNKLTDREVEILDLISKGQVTPEIAGKLGLSKRTVDNHRKNMLNKMGAQNTGELVYLTIKYGILEVVR